MENKIKNLLLENGAMMIGNNQLVVGMCAIRYSMNETTGAFILDIISTPVESRNSGEATKIMNILTLLSDQTKQSIELTIAPIKKPKDGIGYFMKSDIVGNIARQTKNKIPVSKLKNWYKKFGFIENGLDNNRIKMIYIPE